MNTYSSVKSFDSQIQGRKLDSVVAIVSNQSRHHEPLPLNDNHLDQFTEAKTKKKKLTQGVQGKPQPKPKVVIAKKPPQSPPKTVKKTKKPLVKKLLTTAPKKKLKETDKKTLTQQRRAQYGLDYLTEKQIKQLKQRSVKVEPKEKVTLKHPIVIDRSPAKIKQYIQTKKRQELQEKLQKRALTHIDQLRKEKNLLKLNESVKKIFKRVESPKFEIKKKHNADKLYDEYRQEIDEHLNKIRDEKQDKTLELKQKFQELTKRFNNVQEKQQPHIEEQVSEENYDQSIQDIDIFRSKYLDEKIHQILEQQEFVDPHSLTAEDLQVLQFHYLNQAATMIQKVWKGYWMRKIFLIQLQEMFEEEERQQQLEMIDNEDQTAVHDNHDHEQYDFQEHQRPQDQQFIEDSQQAQQFFFNPFNVGNAGPNEKQIHYSTIKSSIASEEEQKSFLQSSMVQHLQQELENWNSQIEQIISEKDAQNFVQVKQKMQNQILSIVSQHFKKRRTSDHERNQDQQLENEQSVDLRRSQQEVQHEKSFNEARKKLQHQHSSEELRQSPCQSDLNGNRSSLISLQGQLLKKENEILAMREDSINLRYKAELKKSMTSEQKKELDNWLESELEDLRRTKNAIELSRKKEASALKKIQRDILIAQNYDDSPEVQQLQCKIDEQFSSLKKQDSIKVVDIFQDELEHESFEEQQHSDRDDNMRQNMIESDKQIELYQTVSMMTGDILEEMIDQISYEMLNHKDQFEIVIAHLIASNQLLAGISTSPQTINTYIDSLISFAIDKYGDQILERLNAPYGFDCLKRMRLIHGYEDDEYEEDYQDNQVAFVLDEQLFLEFEQLRLKDDIEDNYALKELEHIHNKAIFDACNEALNYFRPHYYNAGLPYPWDNKTTYFKISSLSQPLINMTKRVLGWSKMFCGFLPIENQEVASEKQEIMDEKNQQMIVQKLTQDPAGLELDAFQNAAFQQQQTFDYLSQLRDERLYRMLIQEIKDQEYKWYHFSDDKTEFLMEMADMIFETLVEEITSEL